MTTRVVSGLLAGLCLLAQAQDGSVVRLYPVDDSSRDPTFRAFVKKLQSVVEAHDTKALRKMADKEVVSGPSEDDTGWAKFTTRWRPDDPESTLWHALSDLLDLGFTRELPTLFVSPYLVWKFPRELSAASYLVVIRDRAELRAAPSLKAPVLALLSFDVVRKLGQPEGGEGLGKWVRVSMLDGRSGYVNARDVMSPLMPRAQFGRRNGKWLLIALEGPN